MVRPSIFSDESYNIYELHAELKHAVTSGEASANTIEIAGVEAHAVVIADEEYARGYANGILSTITNVTYPAAATVVAFSSLTEGDIVDIYFPVTGTASGSLVSNTDTGKLDLPRLQTVQGWQVTANQVLVEECGSERKEPIDLRSHGTVVLGLWRHGNTALADFAAAHEGDSDGAKIPLLIDVIDTTVATTSHDLLFQATVTSFNRAGMEAEGKQGIITDTVAFKFIPDVVPLEST